MGAQGNRLADVGDAAAVFIAQQPGGVQRLFDAHQPDEHGRCKGCGTPGTGSPREAWPCTHATLAARAEELLASHGQVLPVGLVAVPPLHDALDESPVQEDHVDEDVERVAHAFSAWLTLASRGYALLREVISAGGDEVTQRRGSADSVLVHLDPAIWDAIVKLVSEGPPRPPAA